MPSRRPFPDLAAFFCLLIVLTLALPCPPVEARSPDPSPPGIKAVQVIILETPSLKTFPSQLRRWKEAGFDTVILRAFHVAGDRPHGPAANLVREGSQGVYFPTDEAPVIMDLVSPFAAMCHEVGMKAFAWMVTRDARFGNARLPAEMVYDPPSGTIRPVPRLDILDPMVLEYLERLFADLARTGIDGILLQDDLSSRMAEGFSKGNIRRYMLETGAAVKPYLYLARASGGAGESRLTAAGGFDSWVAWKTRQLVRAARRLEDTVDKTAPGTPLAMNQMYEALTDPPNGRLWLSQDLRLSLDDGPRYAALMLYHRQMQEELGTGPAETLDLIGRSLEELGRKVAMPRVILKFQSADWATGDPIPAADLLGTLRTAGDGKWSVAIVPPPTEEQMRAITPVLGGM